MNAATHMTDTERSRLEARLAEIEKEIDSAKQWGAYLTVLDEERRGIRFVLRTDEGSKKK